jgi:hypothetical protein
MQNRWKHENGVTGWSYQHDWNGGREFIQASKRGQFMTLPTPALWHQDSLARALGFQTFRSGDGSFLDAWAESYASERRTGGDHGLAASGQCIPWIQAKLWNATLTEDGIHIKPVHFGPRTEKSAQIMTPDGLVQVQWDEKGNVKAPPGVTVEPVVAAIAPIRGGDARKSSAKPARTRPRKVLTRS